MKKRLPVIIGVICTILVAVFYSFYTDKTHQIYDNNVNTAVYSAIGIPTEGFAVEQTFTCQEDRIDAFLIKSDVSGSYEDTVVKVQVYDPQTGDLLSEGEEAGTNIKARKLHKYVVEPIEGYKGKELKIVVTEENTTETDGITLYYQPGESTPGSFVVNGNNTDGVFVMKTVTERFDLETCLVMLISEWFIWGFMWFLYRLFK